MKKIVIFLFCALNLSCKHNNDEQNIIYRELSNYRKELKQTTEILDYSIQFKKEKNEYLNAGSLDSTLTEFDKSFKNLKSNEKAKKIQVIKSFSNKYPLYLKSDTSGFNKLSDNIFNILIEIEFYKVKNQAKSILLRPGCK